MLTDTSEASPVMKTPLLLSPSRHRLVGGGGGGEKCGSTGNPKVKSAERLNSCQAAVSMSKNVCVEAESSVWPPAFKS